MRCRRCELEAETSDLCDTCLRFICNERIHYQRVADYLTALGLCAWSVDRLMIGLLERQDRHSDRASTEPASRSP